ncbi:MAG: hypothetical protein LAO06_20345, partial [Acidobacteriia bacterium]|nr:hypothetical protein [Terriglobia bacterium]
MPPLEFADGVENGPEGELSREPRKKLRRPRSAPKGFGSYIDALLHYGHACEDRDESYTSYLKRICREQKKDKKEQKKGTVANKVQPETRLPVSVRQLTRVKVSGEFPNIRLLRALAQRFAQFPRIEGNSLSPLGLECLLPRLNWEAMEREKQRLHPGSTVSVFMGLIPLRALDQITTQMAKGVARDVVDRHMTYSLVFPRPVPSLMKGVADQELEPAACIE